MAGRGRRRPLHERSRAEAAGLTDRPARAGPSVRRRGSSELPWKIKIHSINPAPLIDFIDQFLLARRAAGPKSPNFADHVKEPAAPRPPPGNSTNRAQK